MREQHDRRAGSAQLTHPLVETDNAPVPAHVPAERLRSALCIANVQNLAKKHLAIFSKALSEPVRMPEKR
jgi:hypothetical protein